MTAKLKAALLVLRQYFLAVILMVLAFIANLNTILGKLLPQLPSSTPPVALIYHASGDASFRNAFDTIWLPVPEKALLYSGDFIRTGKGGKARVTLDPSKDPTLETNEPEKLGPDGTPDLGPDTIELAEDTFVRISIERGSYKIKLMSGDVEVRVINTDTKVVIQSGTSSREVDSTTRVISNKPNNRGLKDAPETDEDEEGKDDLDMDEIEAQQQEEEEKKKDIQHRTIPRNGLSLLFMTEQDFLFRFAEKCIKRCTLKIWRNEIPVAESSFREGAVITWTLRANSSSYGNYRWQVTLDGKPIDGVFAVLPYTKENVSRLLNENADLEVNF